MPQTFRRLFEGPDEIDYAPDPMGRVGAGMEEIHDPTDDPRGNALFQDFREAWAEGRGLPELFGGEGMLEIKEPVGPAARNRRPDVAKLETFLDALGAHDAARTDGPTGYYGIGLEDNLMAYQARNGLTPDGLVNPDGETLGRIKQDLAETLGPESLARPTPAVPQDGIGSLVGQRAIPLQHAKEPPPPIPARVIPAAATSDPPERKLMPVPKGSRIKSNLVIDYENTWLGAQQGTSPHVYGSDGTPNYQRASDAWQRYYKRYQARSSIRTRHDLSPSTDCWAELSQ